MRNSKALNDLKMLYQDKILQLELSIKYLYISQAEIDILLDQINYLKNEIENIEKEK